MTYYDIHVTVGVVRYVSSNYEGGEIMSGSMRYTTVESSREILTRLYENDAKDRFFACRIIVPTPRLDAVEDRELTIYLSRLYDTSFSYQMRNGDRIYRTIAKLTPDEETFGVDVVIRSREASVVGATLSLSDEVNRIIANR